jgi:hypothetical protein
MVRRRNRGSIRDLGACQVLLEGQFESTEGAEAVGFSHSDFGFAVQAFDTASFAGFSRNQLTNAPRKPTDSPDEAER